MNKVHKRYLKPRAVDLGTAYNVDPWFSTAYDAEPYFGLKYWSEGPQGPDGSAFEYKIEAKYYIACKGVR